MSDQMIMPQDWTPEQQLFPHQVGFTCPPFDFDAAPSDFLRIAPRSVGVHGWMLHVPDYGHRLDQRAQNFRMLEEFATVSTDMVDRLHDQNAGKSIPTHFNREYAEMQLETLALPGKNRVVDMFSRGGGIRSLHPARVPGGTETVLTDSFLRASHRTVEPRKESAMEKDPGRAAFVRVHAGEGRIFIAAENELDRPGRTSIPLAAGDLFMIPPGIHYGFKNETDDPLTCSEHRIETEKAFI